MAIAWNTRVHQRLPAILATEPIGQNSRLRCGNVDLQLANIFSCDLSNFLAVCATRVQSKPLNHLRKHCAMHTNNLGIYLILNCEGLQVLAKHRSTMWLCTFNEALGHLYDDFRTWCRSNHIQCSHRKWSEKQLHLVTAKGEKTFGWLNAKTFNARVILAWLSKTKLHFYGKNSTKVTHVQNQAKRIMHVPSSDSPG